MPVAVHEVISIILLLPLGALVSAFVQTVIGIRTIGTFSPTLIALSFILADWRTGIVVFTLVILIGLMARSLVDPLRLLMVPRLGFMLTLVVVFLVFTISVLDYLRLTPDIRVIVYRSQPAMAMARLPTQHSQGKANLHQGAVAAAIDLDSGKAYGGVLKNRAVDRHPDTHALLSELTIPCWSEVLNFSSGLVKRIGLDFVGVDLVIDRVLGPIVLEANARPGLAIQMANRSGLLLATHRIDARL